MEGSWPPCVWSNFLSAILPTAFAHLASLCHILEIFMVFQTFSVLLYVFLVICGWCSLTLLLRLPAGSDDG